MATVPSTASAGVFAPGATIARVWNRLAKFLIRRRILLSALLFIALIAEDVYSGHKPRDPLNLRDPVSLAGIVLVGVGLALRAWSAGILHKNRLLTTTGPYRLIRNPLYVGSFLMMFGFCTLIGDAENFLIILGPVLLIYIVKVQQEEKVLSGLFPAEWASYIRRTPRFFPRLARADVKSEWSLAQWRKLREYQALVTTVAALVAIKFWQAYL